MIDFWDATNMLIVGLVDQSWVHVV